MGVKATVLIVVICVLFPITVSVTYLWAVHNKHVNPWFPYISSTGDKPRESTLFSQTVNVVALLYLAIVHLRYLQVEKLCTTDHITELNDVSAVFGYLAACGLTIIANVQETSFPPVHVTGASLAFFGGLINFTIQSVIANHVGEKLNGHDVIVFRIVLCTMGWVFLVAAIVCGLIAKLNYQKAPQERLLWSKEDGGYMWHIASTLSEWTVVAIYDFYLASYYFDFARIEILKDRIVIS